MTDQLQTIPADKIVDARGTACPGPLLEAKKAIGAVRVCQIVEVLSGDQATRNDLPVWANKRRGTSTLAWSRRMASTGILSAARSDAVSKPAGV